MLNELSISNFALIDEITINFDEGLNIFTGTTGVGKSLIIGALNFLLGSRTTNDIARSKTKDVSVSGLFFIKNSQIRQSIKGHIDKIDDEEIIIQRSLDQKGRNRCKLNNQPITVSLLKEIGELLVNIHGQHEHESLTNPQQQLRTLDSFGKLDDLRSEYSTIYNNALEKEKRLHSLNDQHSERKKQLELYRYEIDEIERCQLQPEEDKSLEEERYILANSEKIQNVLSLCSNSLYESDNSIIDGLKDITNELSKIMGIDKGFENTLEVCNQTIYQLEDIANTLRNDVEKYDYDPRKLEQIEERIETIRSLKRKYGDSIENILSHGENAKAKLEILLKENEDTEIIEKELKQLKNAVINTGKTLTQHRKKTGKKLSALIKNELTDLGIPDGKFDINISALDNSDQDQTELEHASSSGFDRIEFMFSSNPGEELKPLRKVASGGEISRIMLALKRHLALADKTPVLIFDEIDANIGGRMGRIIGEKLSLVAQSHQVICITHLPQIASYAKQHFKVNKTVKSNKTFVTIDNLSSKEQLEEIAEMIRGAEKSVVTRKQAKEMLDDAKNFMKQMVAS
ncbi:MAG: DNA repair protein RecN [Candidatus Scalindua sp.]|jgi:DNA repair protein RecN (Recombination protein N)|nr:DNA repair protein RecN [Candidatus Scalindua sp.]MBT6225431.1 DNA repair protein RecN [Candidatus Scalindua sp.]MBT6564201.1 DNA repair protein RecN [Candidatus Scalindua sp.]MBT7213524.1 DNA repair protein RecN [Candidatus Scalindua sp.]MBT7589926.1 DNA repair protein RecN [Candidatus Scalindua sp.]